MTWFAHSAILTASVSRTCPGPHVLQNVRKLIDAASDKSLAEACLARLNLPLDDPVVGEAPHLSPAMAATWRVYRESSLDVLPHMVCTEPLFKSRVVLPQLLKWAAQNGADSASVPKDSQRRSEWLRHHLVLATESALRLEVADKAAASVEALWSGWFAALVPDIDAERPLPMTAYAILANSVKRPVVHWPRLLQVWCQAFGPALLHSERWRCAPTPTPVPTPTPAPAPYLTRIPFLPICRKSGEGAVLSSAPICRQCVACTIVCLTQVPRPWRRGRTSLRPTSFWRRCQHCGGCCGMRTVAGCTQWQRT